jgi:hypothetical protein
MSIKFLIQIKSLKNLAKLDFKAMELDEPIRDAWEAAGWPEYKIQLY